MSWSKVKCCKHSVKLQNQWLTGTVVHAASVNYRDLILVKVRLSFSCTRNLAFPAASHIQILTAEQGQYLYPHRIGAVQGSDGAGSVEAVGSRVSRFKPGDKVLTTFNQQHLFGDPDLRALASGLGAGIDGVLRQYGVFDEEGLVSLPSNLTYLEGSALPCAAVTAWSSLYGLGGKALKAGDWVLTQGTGGVSMFALQVSSPFSTTGRCF